MWCCVQLFLFFWFSSRGDFPGVLLKKQAYDRVSAPGVGLASEQNYTARLCWSESAQRPIFLCSSIDFMQGGTNISPLQYYSREEIEFVERKAKEEMTLTSH